MFDIIIIGAGPAGLTSAIYSKQASKNVLVLEKETYGGQILSADKIKNYPGFTEITGFEFSTNLYNQVKNLGVEIKYEEVIKIKNHDNFKEVLTNKDSYKCKCIVIATGAKNRMLNLNNEKKFIGKGISYCPTCDGMFFKDKNVAILGGGNTAISSAIYLSDIANKVYFIYRQKNFKDDSLNLDEVKNKDNIKVILNSNVTELLGEDKLEKIKVKENDSNKELILDTDGLFIAIGHVPVSSICENLIDINDKGYIVSNEECVTNIDGIFVAGDVRTKNVRQLTTACSDGTIAAVNAIKYLNKK